MNVKINTKEKFAVIGIAEAVLPANMAGELEELILTQMGKPIPHLVLNLEKVEEMDAQIAEIILTTQQKFYENHSSMVVCCMHSNVESHLDKLEILELLNMTATESEAWDIVQMEEIEREIMGGEE